MPVCDCALSQAISNCLGIQQSKQHRHSQQVSSSFSTALDEDDHYYFSKQVHSSSLDSSGSEEDAITASSTSSTIGFYRPPSPFPPPGEAIRSLSTKRGRRKLSQAVRNKALHIRQEILKGAIDPFSRKKIDFLGILAAITSNLYIRETNGSGYEQAKAALNFFRRENACRQLEKAWNQRSDVVQFYLPQLLSITILKLSDKDTIAWLEIFIIQKCRNSVLFCLLCWWYLQSINRGALWANARESSSSSWFSVIRKKESKPKTSYSSGDVAFCDRLLHLISKALMDESGDLEHDVEFPSAAAADISTRGMSTSDEDGITEGSSDDDGIISGNRMMTRPSLRKKKYSKVPPLLKAPNIKATPECLAYEERELLNMGKDLGKFFQKEVQFVDRLMSISQLLIEYPVEEREKHLQEMLEECNQMLPNVAFVPLCSLSHPMHCVLRIPTEEAHVFNTKKRAPYQICLEIAEIDTKWGNYGQCFPATATTRHSPDLTPTTTRHSPDLTLIPPPVSSAKIETSSPSLRPLSPIALRKFSGSTDSNDTDDIDPTTTPEGHLQLHEETSDNSNINNDEEEEEEEEEENKKNDSIKSAAFTLFEEDIEKEVCDRDRFSLGFRECWKDHQLRVKQTSPYGHVPGWKLISVIVKSNDDLRQEQFAAQFVTLFDEIFRNAELPLWLCPYRILAVSATAGIIEVISDAISLHTLKKENQCDLASFMCSHFGSDPMHLRMSQISFMQSLAGYSILTYVLNVKDRHNGNILLDAQGHIIHIDFGFMFTNTPGSIQFEKAPFKLTLEYVQVMGGISSHLFNQYVDLVVRGFLEIRKHTEDILALVEMGFACNEDMSCFAGGKDRVFEELKARLFYGHGAKESAAAMRSCIRSSLDNFFTRQYDNFQRIANGIVP